MQSDPSGLDGGINVYTYVNANPLVNIDSNGLNCIAVDGNVTCNTPSGAISFPRPAGWPATIGPDNPSYHVYNVPVELNGADPGCVMNGIVNNPTPGSPGPASAQGTLNNATPTSVQKLFDVIDLISSFGNNSGGFNDGPVLSYVVNDGSAVVNVTLPGHTLFPGYVMRNINSGQVNNFGEGLGYLQGEVSQRIGLAGQINGVWNDQTQGIINSCGCQKH